MVEWLATGNASIGASGAVAGFLAMAVIMLAPRLGLHPDQTERARRTQLLASGGSAIALLGVFLWLALRKPGTEIGHWAHVTGYIVGLVAAVMFEWQAPASPWAGIQLPVGKPDR